MGAQFALLKKQFPIFPKMRLSASSGELPDVPPVVRDRCSPCEVLWKLTENCSMGIIRVESAGTETNECFGDNKNI